MKAQQYQNFAISFRHYRENKLVLSYGEKNLLFMLPCIGGIPSYASWGLINLLVLFDAAEKF
jgi:hypothetical protein